MIKKLLIAAAAMLVVTLQAGAQKLTANVGKVDNG